MPQDINTKGRDKIAKNKVVTTVTIMLFTLFEASKLCYFAHEREREREELIQF